MSIVDQHGTPPPAGSFASHSAPALGYISFICAVAALGGFLFGFDSGVINGTVTALSQTFQSDSVAT